MSALDLFASAMGAFVLLAVIALPYYLNIDQTDLVKSQKEEIEGLKKKAAFLKSKIANAIDEKIHCEKSKKKLIDDMAGMGTRNESLQSTVQGQAAQIASLKSRLENTIKFSLLGISTKATSFTIVVDLSGSMSHFKVTIAETLKRLLKPMRNKCKIQIIGYSGDSQNPHILSWHTPHEVLLYDDAHASSMHGFIQKMISNIGGETPTLAALKEALKYDTEAVILFTDGDPNGSPSKIVNEISRLNNGKKEIHAVAIGNYIKKRSLTEFLINLSSKNRGGFMGVASID